MGKSLSTLSEKCKVCPKVDDCSHKEMQLCAVADLPLQINASQGIVENMEMPIMREQIKNPLSPFAYKDELEKALNDYHFGYRFMKNGV